MCGTVLFDIMTIAHKLFKGGGLTMKGIIINKYRLFSVLLTENNDFILIKNIPNATVGSEAFVLDIETATIPKPFYKLFLLFF